MRCVGETPLSSMNCVCLSRSVLHTLSHWYTLTVPTKLMEAEWILLPGLLRAYYQKEENKLNEEELKNTTDAADQIILLKQKKDLDDIRKQINKELGIVIAK